MENFDDIRPYNEDEAPAAYYKLMDDRHFQDAVAKCLPDYSIDMFRSDFPSFKSIEGVQASFIRRFIETFLKHSSSGVDFSGIENVEPDKAYLYIANHRDISFDSAMLQYYFFLEQRHTSKIAIGDNLIQTPTLGEVARLNKMFIVKRSGSLRERLIFSHHLSAYIQHSILKEGESVWIAQRDGRTKDGHDYTKQGLLKMITMGHPDGLVENVRQLHITPVTISYEYEPCDALKARELALSGNGQHYQKYPGEDFDSIKQGIFGHKGKISLVIGTPLSKALNTMPSDLNNNDKLLYICKLIDEQIYKNYRLYSTNYIAHDLLHGDNAYSSFYTSEEKERFIDYLQKKAVVRDVSAEKMMNNLLHIYGTPVDTHFGNPVTPIL